jgi:hypothetical protein
MTDHSSSTAPKLALPTQFALHLMASLVGTSRLEEYLLGEQSKLPLYWRTNVVLANASTACFADISMTIDSTNESPLKISVGVLRRGTNGEYRYSQGVLKEGTLTNYLESVGIDVETTAPSVVANSVAQALVSISSFEATNSPRLLSDSALDSSVCISLYHQDVEESGYLTIDMGSDCALSLAVATMLLSNLEQSSSTTAVAEEEYDTSALEQMFVERLVAMRHATNGGSKRQAAPDGHSSATAMARLSPELQCIKPIRPPRGGGGVRAGSNRRKKAKTLSYGATKK